MRRTSEEKKRRRRLAFLFINSGIVVTIANCFSVELIGLSFTAISFTVAVGFVCWITGWAYYASSRGYSFAIGLVCGAFPLIGVPVLLLMHDRSPIRALEPPHINPSNYPR